jgi:nitrous oxide reductase accessory protein NosL
MKVGRHGALSGLLLTIPLLLIACGGPPETGPVDARWDRTVCKRCRMVLSDRNHAAQIRYMPAGKQRTQVEMFDDIGCAILWLDEQAWKDSPDIEIWVNDWRNGNWIDARTATYIIGQTTPMEYGLGAQSENAADGLTFDQARTHIQQVEERYNTHGAHLKQQAGQRQSNHPGTPR